MYTIKLIRDLNYDEKFWNVSAEAVEKEQGQRYGKEGAGGGGEKTKLKARYRGKSK